MLLGLGNAILDINLVVPEEFCTRVKLEMGEQIDLNVAEPRFTVEEALLE
jgi:hypothetical protein